MMSSKVKAFKEGLILLESPLEGRLNLNRHDSLNRIIVLLTVM